MQGGPFGGLLRDAERRGRLFYSFVAMTVIDWFDGVV